MSYRCYKQEKLKVKTHSGRLATLAMCVVLIVVALPFSAFAAFLMPSGAGSITIGTDFADWGTVGSPTTGVYIQQDGSNSGQDDGSGFAGKQEDLNYFWTGISTQSGGSTPASGSNLIQNIYYRMDTLSTTNFNGNKYNIQLNSGAASVGYADHLLHLWVDNGSTPKVKIVLLQYENSVTYPYPAMRAFTTGRLTGVVSNVANPYSGYTGVVDANATGAIGTYTYNSTTYYTLEISIPVGWFNSTYGSRAFITTCHHVMKLGSSSSFSRMVFC